MPVSDYATSQIAQVADFQNRVLGAIVATAVSIYNETTNDVASLSITGTATGGTFTMNWNGQVTAAIPFNASAGQVQLVLSGLSNVGAGNVVCSGGPLPGTPVSISWCGTLGNAPQNLPTTGTNSLTGTAPAPAYSHTVIGVSAINHTSRQALASKILNNPSGYQSLFGLGVASQSAVQADYPAPSFALNVTGAQADTDINAAVSSIFNAYT